MKLTLQTQLFPSKDQVAKLEATLRAFNAGADWLAGKAFEIRCSNKVELQKLHYAELRERFNLSAQMAVRCIAQVCEAYKRDKKKRPSFRPFASMPFDQRMMSFKGVDKVSLLTLEGRIIVPFAMGKYQSERFTAAKGQSDLVRRKDGLWFLLVTVDLPDGTKTPTTDFLGVDLGVAQIAATSDGDLLSGDAVEACRQKFAASRRALQKGAAAVKARGKRPKNIRRKLKRQSSKESRFRRDVNHCISKKLVETAKGTGRGIALEDLQGIRDRIRLRRRQRARIHGWSFSQLRQFIEYKGQFASVEVVTVDPRNTSRTCNNCGVVDKASRRSQSEYKCKHCGHESHADLNASRNIRDKAKVMWLKVSEQSQEIAA